MICCWTISSITPLLLRDALKRGNQQVLNALLKNVSKEEFIGKPKLMQELIDINSGGYEIYIVRYLKQWKPAI